MFSSRRVIALPGLFMAVLASSSLFVCDLAAAQGPNAAAPVGRSPGSRVMTLEPLSDEERAAQSLLKNPKNSQEVPEGFREFGTARSGQVVETKSLTLRFAGATTLTKIAGTPDFKVEQGGSCVGGYAYAANSTCTVLVRFTPQGAGYRLGKLEIANSAEVMPLFVGLGGNGYAPTISFTPSIISTVPGTYVSGAGTISGAYNLAVDGGDSLYIADTGNNAIKSIDSSGTIYTNNAQLGSDSPISVLVDHSGFVYFTQQAQDYFLNILQTDDGEPVYVGGNTYCAIGATCALYGAGLQVAELGDLALDPNGNIFLNSYGVAARILTQNGPAFLDYIPLYTPYNFTYNPPYPPGPLAVDSSDTLYTFYGGYATSSNSAICIISGQPLYAAENDLFGQVTVAGNQNCGFSGDGGQARGAEIGEQVGQMVFDNAGNLYFSDTTNQRVRRIDNSTGIITTIAGNGTTGYNGDGGPATSAALNHPTGVAVDSQGQVYILSNSSTTGSAQVVRKVGTVGALYLGGMTVGGSSTAQTVTVANTGNANLDVSRAAFTSGNTADFAMDPTTTSCVFTVPLASGHSCKIGFIFTPGAAGSRSAVLSITDDTVTNLNTIQVSGTGYTTATLTPASFTFANTNYGSTSAQQTATLTNTGKAAMAISSIAISGTNATSFSDSTNCGTSLAVGASCTVSVVFVPQAAGALSAQLTVSDNAITGRQYVSLTGTGVAVAKASITPTSLTFASTAIGSTSAAQTITLSNTGSAALGVTSISMTGTNPGDFSITKTCGTSVAAGASCGISVSFKPAATGTRTATVSIVASTGTITAAVSGTAVAAAKAAISPASLAFSSQTVASASAAKVATLSNSGGAPLTITSFAFSGTNAADFSQTHTCTSSLAPAASCTISVVFKPAAAGARSATLATVTSAGSVTVALTGTGAAASAKATVVSLSEIASPVDAQSIVLIAQVKSNSSFMPLGNVQLWEGSHLWMVKDLSQGAAQFAMGELASGVHKMNAVYLGNDKNSGSRSAIVEVMVPPTREYKPRRLDGPTGLTSR